MNKKRKMYFFEIAEMECTRTGFVTKVTLRVSHVEQEVITLPEHLIFLPNFDGIRAARSLVFCVIFCRLLFVLSSSPYSLNVLSPGL
jgi:hypothetical protein